MPGCRDIISRRLPARPCRRGDDPRRPSASSRGALNGGKRKTAFFCVPSSPPGGDGGRVSQQALRSDSRIVHGRTCMFLDCSSATGWRNGARAGVPTAPVSTSTFGTSTAVGDRVRSACVGIWLGDGVFRGIPSCCDRPMGQNTLLLESTRGPQQ